MCFFFSPKRKKEKEKQGGNFIIIENTWTNEIKVKSNSNAATTGSIYDRNHRITDSIRLLRIVPLTVLENSVLS